jgi:hypothetical protein
MFRPVAKGVTFAVSPRGRKVIRGAVRAARSDEVRKVVGHARSLATRSETRQAAVSAARTVASLGKAVRTAEGRERLKAAARLIADQKP